MKNILLSTFFLCMTFTYIYGQKQGNIWYFGNTAGVDFNSGSPTALLDGQLTFPIGQAHNEGTSSISDSSGSILFYSDGMTVWNKNHQVMQNGTGLLGNFSSTQSSIIVPDPANSNQYYYLFTVSSLMGSAVGANISDGLRYSKVDMCLDNFVGGIVSEEKNVKLVDSVAEKIAVTRHSNGIDYWILTHKFYSNEFWALRLTSLGIEDTVITAIGSYHIGDEYGVQGQLKFSPNGQKVAIAASNGLDILEVFDFDKTTGVISNSMPLYKPNNNNASIYGVEFSSDGSKLYASGVSSLGQMYAFLVQYDLNAGGGSLSAINASMFSIYTNTTGLIGGKGLQIAPNDKIYWVSLSNSSTLAVITNPNIYGVGCNYQDQNVSLGGRQGFYSLPSFISDYNYSNEMVTCLNTSIQNFSINESLNISPNPFLSSITLVLNAIDTENRFITITDITSREVKSIAINNLQIGNNKIIIDLSELNNGIYFCKVISNSDVKTVKILKNGA